MALRDARVRLFELLECELLHVGHQHPDVGSIAQQLHGNGDYQRLIGGRLAALDAFDDYAVTAQFAPASLVNTFDTSSSAEPGAAANHKTSAKIGRMRFVSIYSLSSA